MSKPRSPRVISFQMALIPSQQATEPDYESMSLILQLQKQDLSALMSSCKGKCREEHVTDLQMALQTYELELECNFQIQSDRHMATSVTRALDEDLPLLSTIALEERTATEDRALALRISGKVAPRSIRKAQSLADDTSVFDQFLAKAKTLSVYETGGQELLSGTEQQGESSNNGTKPKDSSLPPTMLSRCVACVESKPFFDIALLPCKHQFCRECLEHLFESSLTDETLYPPKCCRQKIDLDSVRLYLSATLLSIFEEKQEEFETLDKTYCCAIECAGFIRSAEIDAATKTGTCRNCQTKTCVICKSAAHQGECPKDEAMAQLAQLAQQEGWQTCRNCKRYVELDQGCFHMT